MSCALSCNMLGTNIFLCSECGTKNWKGEIIYFLGWWRTFAIQGGTLCALFCPSAKATFTVLFCFFLFPLYIITKIKFVYFVTITSLPQTEMHLNNPCESAAKATLWESWQGCCWRRAARTPSQGCYTLSSYSACLSLLTVGHDLPPGWWLLASSKQGSGK